ncbi:MAG: GNAT family N-acetyltransferase [Clostridia bacterium]|nr:GNAT family N-acetyltransferase [Clostridia bacterium]
MKNNITYGELPLENIKEYENISMNYTTNKKYQIKKINNGLGGIIFELVDVPEFYKDFGVKVEHWKEIFDLTNWKFFVAYNAKNELVAGCVVATKTANCRMLEGRDDIAVLWDIRVSNEYKRQGIGQKLFDMAIKWAKDSGFKTFKVECQNTNTSAVKFYHKQGMELCAINEFAYPDYPNEAQLLWYLNLKD